jgi:hypothetical protein
VSRSLASSMWTMPFSTAKLIATDETSRPQFYDLRFVDFGTALPRRIPGVTQVHVEGENKLIPDPSRIAPSQLDDGETASGDVLVGVTGCLTAAEPGDRRSSRHADSERWYRWNSSVENRPARSCGIRSSSLPTRVINDIHRELLDEIEPFSSLQ